MIVSNTWYNKKSRIINFLADKVQISNEKDKSIKITNRYEDILGITKSLRIDASNFIVHFKSRGDEIWYSEKRDEIIRTFAERYK